MQSAEAMVDERRWDVTAVHADHADFVWRTLQRLGVRQADLEDVQQEVFLVVHRRLHTFDGSSEMTTWLFAICLRVASAYRRRAHRRRELSMSSVPEDPKEACARGPDEAAEQSEARETLLEILDSMDLPKRAVFVMFEVEGLTCGEIAATTGVPIGTVYSRLSAARADFTGAVQRVRARQARGGLG